MTEVATSSRPIAPGTPIFGVVFRDGTTGAWTSVRSETLRMGRECSAIGIAVVGILVARMKSEELIEKVHVGEGAGGA